MGQQTSSKCSVAGKAVGIGVPVAGKAGKAVGIVVNALFCLFLSNTGE